MLHRVPSRAASNAARGIRLTLLITLLVATILATSMASAEGSRDLQTDRISLGAPDVGYRPFIEWHDSASSAGIPRQTTLKAYAQPGESIYIGSSTMGYLQGDVIIRAPNDPPGTWPPQANVRRCTQRAPAGANGVRYGRIENRAQEVFGPNPAKTVDSPPAAQGFVPCVVTAAETTAAGAGIWEFDFISPNPAAALANNPTPIRMDSEWAGQPADISNHWTAAWDVSVRNAADAEIRGRVFANYLAMNLGNNGVGLTTDFYILTRDGYGYEVDMNGIDPFGFVFFANAEGIYSEAEQGRPIYRSVQLTGTNATQSLPPGYRVYNPRLPDNAATGDITHKIFFDLAGPDPSMPATALAPSGTTWLLSPAPQAPPVPGTPTFVGEEGTPGQAGTNPLGGYFEFDAPSGVTYNVVIDTNRNGSFTDSSDRTIYGRTGGTRTRVYWDGLDGTGARVSAGTLPFSAIIRTFVGEVHFPFIDAENHQSGHRLRRVRDAGLPLIPAREPWLIYYNDAYTYPAVQPYDYSSCSSTDGANQPPASANIAAPSCYGTHNDPDRIAIDGTSSQNGAHSWTTSFGDRRVIDTWTYYPSDPVSVNGNVLLAEAELSIEKSHSPAALTPGEGINYTVVVRNGGPSPAVAARVRDDVPAQVIGVTWSCAVTTGAGRCGETTGSGNLISTTVDLDPGAVITYSITGTLDPDAEGTLSNTASVRRPNDNTDPNLTNNDDTDIAPIIPVADLELTKRIVSAPPLVVNGVLEFRIDLRNRGPSRANQVEVSDRLPAGLTFVSATPSKGTYDSSSGLWSVGIMARNEVATLDISARWDGTPLRNTAQVTRSEDPSGQNLRDPDSTPNNNDPTEDDQSSVDLPGAIADLELTKVVNRSRVNVGQNVVFTIALSNRGPDQATNVRVTDRLPAGLSFVRATPAQGTYDPISGAWSVGTLATGARTTLTIEVTVLGPGPFTNSAQVSAADQFDPDSTPNNDIPNEDDQGFATVGGDLSDLALAKGVNNSQPNLGEEITYTVTLRNEGPSTATGVAVTDRLPGGLAFVSATASQGTYDQATGLWTIGTVPSGGQATLSLRATVQSVARIVNTAEITAADQPDPDSVPGNNDPNEDDQASVPISPQIADLRLTKSASTTRPTRGGNVSFSIVLTNDGPFPATGVQVSERLPVGLTYLSHQITRGATVTTDGYSPATGIWQVGNVSVSESITLTLNARMDGVGPFTNSAEVTSSDQYDPDSTPNNGIGNGEDDQASVSISSPIADLSVSKRASAARPAADGSISYVVGVHNAGPDPATNVTVGEQLPAGAAFVSASTAKGTYDSGTGSWAVGDLAVGESALLTVTVRLSGTGPFVNRVEVTGSDQYDPDSTPGNNDPSEDDYASVSLPSDPIDLELAKTVVFLDKVERGALFRISLVNRGPGTATEVAVEEKLSPGLRLVSVSPSQGFYDTSTGIWTVGTLLAGDSAELLVAAQITVSDSTEIRNTAQVARAGQLDIDSTPNNNIESEDDQATVRFSLLTPVTLKGLRARQTTEGVRVEWETGMELSTRGFYLLYSANGSKAQAARLSMPLVTARGSGLAGASYSFLDTAATPGSPHTYWVVEVAENGAITEYGPVTAAQFSTYLPMVIK